MTLYLFSNTCTSCSQRHRLSKLRTWCVRNNVTLEVKSTLHHAKNQRELLPYLTTETPNTYQPLIVNPDTGGTVEFKKFTEEALEALCFS